MILGRYLAEHGPSINALDRAAFAVKSIEKFVAHQRKRGAIAGVLAVSDLGLSFVSDFAKFRRDAGIGDATIKRELGVLRTACNWAGDNELLASVPRIPKLTGKGKLRTQPRRLAYNLPQIAAILDAAWSDPRRHHVHLFALTMLASHARTEAILECDLDLQYHDGVLDWLGPGREQTKKRRSMTPAGPTLASWLEGRSGKLIVYRTVKAEKRWAAEGVPEYFTRPTYSIDTALEGALIAAGAAHPSLKLRAPLLDSDGVQRMHVARRREGNRFVDCEPVPMWQGIGSPNTFRHSVHTQLRRIGVNKAVLEAAAGHAEQGTGENYNNWDAVHDLKELTAGVEALFDELRHYTTVHIRSQDGPKIIDLGAARAARAT